MPLCSHSWLNRSVWVTSGDTYIVIYDIVFGMRVILQVNAKLTLTMPASC